MSTFELAPGVSPIRKLRVTLMVMALLICLAAFGFAITENLDPLDAIYMTMITITTVGYGDYTPRTQDGKILAMTLIVVGFFVAAATITFLGQLTLEGHFRELVARRKMESKVRKLSSHCLIAGYGRVGRQVAKEFAQRKTPFIVMESAPDGIRQLVDDGYLFAQGDATSDEVLKEAGIERAQTLISTLPEEAQNVYLTLTARYMNSKLTIIARADFEEGETKLRRAGADNVVIPHVLGGIRMAKAALQPNVVDFMDTTAMGEEGLGIEELRLPKSSRLNSKSLMDSSLKSDYGVTIIGIKKKEKAMDVNPGPATILEAGDVLVLLGQVDQLERLSRELHD